MVQTETIRKDADGKIWLVLDIEEVGRRSHQEQEATKLDVQAMVKGQEQRVASIQKTLTEAQDQLATWEAFLAKL